MNGAFEFAEPVWRKGLSETMNTMAGFRSVFELEDGAVCHLRIACASLYRAYFNGVFVGYGPARAAHGWYRVDEWDLGTNAVIGKNVLSIEAVGYNVNSFYLIDVPSFVQAEVVVDRRVIAATGWNGFVCVDPNTRVQKVQRHSFQRTLVEVYHLWAGCDAWKAEEDPPLRPSEIERLESKQLIPRRVAYPRFARIGPVSVAARGVLTHAPPAEYTTDRAWTDIGPILKGYPENELDVHLSHELESFRSEVIDREPHSYAAVQQITLEPLTFRVFDFGQNLTGFIGATVACTEKAVLDLTFDELASENGDVNFLRLRTLAAVRYYLEPGQYTVETIEPYTFRYLKASVTSGRCTITDVYIREYASPECDRASFACSDPDLNGLFDAARETYRQNAVDVFMDCPSRERAGWLLDSLFTARVERTLCGGSRVERNFLENYSLPDRFPFTASGMVPMSYPSDHNNERFIPNYAMWFIIQLAEYYDRTADNELVSTLEARVFGILDYFTRFQNDQGLLEKLEKWVFVEWSDANKYVQDVNFPVNMLYAKALDAAGRLYERPELAAQAEEQRETIRRMSYDGEYFVDNAVRSPSGSLEPTRNRSETCQYYAFFCEVATPATHPKLWHGLVDRLSRSRRAAGDHGELVPSNAFIGFLLRMEVMSRYGRIREVLEQLREDYLPMAQITGTLWEHDDPTRQSCNHGISSHVAHVLVRDILGCSIDYQLNSVVITIPNIALDWCEGTIPVGDGYVRVRWLRRGDNVVVRVRTPAGFAVDIENRTDLGLVVE